MKRPVFVSFLNITVIDNKYCHCSHFMKSYAESFHSWSASQRILFTNYRKRKRLTECKYFLIWIFHALPIGWNKYLRNFFSVQRLVCGIVLSILFHIPNIKCFFKTKIRQNHLQWDSFVMKYIYLRFFDCVFLFTVFFLQTRTSGLANWKQLIGLIVKTCIISAQRQQRAL